jgi:uncharacterized integral membrane protein
VVRLFVLVILTVATVVFAMSNTHHVPVSMLFGSPIQIQMCFLLATAFFSGMVVAYFITVYREAKARALVRALQRIERS